MNTEVSIKLWMVLLDYVLKQYIGKMQSKYSVTKLYLLGLGVRNPKGLHLIHKELMLANQESSNGECR